MLALASNGAISVERNDTFSRRHYAKVSCSVSAFKICSTSLKVCWHNSVFCVGHWAVLLHMLFSLTLTLSSNLVDVLWIAITGYFSTYWWFVLLFLGGERICYSLKMMHCLLMYHWHYKPAIYREKLNCILIGIRNLILVTFNWLAVI